MCVTIAMIYVVNAVNGRIDLNINQFTLDEIEREKKNNVYTNCVVRKSGSLFAIEYANTMEPVRCVRHSHSYTYLCVFGSQSAAYAGFCQLSTPFRCINLNLFNLNQYVIHIIQLYLCT